MGDLPSDSYLNSLNVAQLQAVEHPPHVPLQILAGPGSGKTKVLTSRIAHLILRHSISPSSICAVTFTNKAANEMRERLKKILGKNRIGEVKTGTFHSLCAQFLRKYAHTIGLSDNFSICDADESKRIIRQLLKKYEEFLSARNMTAKEGIVMSKISKAKAKSITADMFAAEVEDKLREKGTTSLDAILFPLDIIEKITAEIYIEYERLLRQNNSLDFDDLLVFGVKMFKAHRNAVTWCRHVLVDEFQDTNTIQYDLMQTIAYKNCVTIVGDPDQSIYGWRSAEVENLANMKRDFPGTQEILLEENYRSTGAILRLSLAIISEDTKRIPKSLHTSHPLGKVPMLQSWPTELDEASFIAGEIKRVIAYMGGSLQFLDFAILLRFNALSRVIERALQKFGIPCRILGGHRFFERLEVKDLLAYLQLVDNPQFYPAFARAVNVPSRGVGEKTLLEIASRAEATGVSHLEVLERIYDGKIPDIKPPVKKKISSFVSTVRALRELAEKRISPVKILQSLLKSIDYSEHLKKTQTDWESRWANVEELINFATEVGIDSENGRNMPSEHSGGSRETPLRVFIQASSLSTEGDNDSDKSNFAEGKVTIATCHAAKGLEWPVVMIPSVEDGTFPLSRSDDIEEERRLLYVACTRAQGLLYLIHAQRRNVAGRTINVDRSPFVENVFRKYPDILTYECPELDPEDRAALCNILRREIPDEAEVARRVVEYYDAIEAKDGPEPPNTVPRQTTSTSHQRTTEPPMPSFQTSNRMLLFHTLERMHNNQVNNNGEKSLKPPDTVPRQRTSTSTIQKRVLTTEPPMPSLQTSNLMLPFQTLERMQDNQINNNVRPSSCNASTANTSTPQNEAWSRSENLTAFARPASPGVIRTTPNRPGSLHAGVSNSLQDMHPITRPAIPDPTSLWSMPNGSDDSQGLDSDFLKPQRSRKPATLTHNNTCVKQVRIKWPGTPQTSQYSQDEPEDGPASDPGNCENFEVSPPLKRRLGMGRVTGGYTNKKFKLPY